MFTFPQTNIPGVAKSRNVNQTDDLVRAGYAKASSSGDFVDPTKVVYQLGIKEGMHVVDMGVGTGAYTKVIANFVGSIGQVYAVDVQKDLLQRLKSEMLKLGYGNVIFLWADIEKKGGTKIADESIDFVLFSNVLFQVEDIDGTLSEAQRLLKRGARVAVIDWTDSFNGMGPAPTAVIPRGTMLAKMHEAGFAYAKDFEAGSHHYGCLFEKPKI